MGSHPLFPHWQVPACPAGNSSSPRCQGSLVSHPQISGLQISQETGIDLKRGDIRLVNPACSEEAKPCSLPLPSSWGPPRHSPEGKNSPISPIGFSSRDAAPEPRALPATWCFPSASLGEREGRAPVPVKGLRFSTSSQSAEAAALSSKEKVFPMPLSGISSTGNACEVLNDCPSQHRPHCSVPQGKVTYGDNPQETPHGTKPSPSLLEGITQGLCGTFK